MQHSRIAAVVIGAVFSLQAGAQNAAPPVTLVGAVVSSVDSTPIIGVSLLAIGTKKQTRTDERGRFKLSGLASETFKLQLLRIGYMPMLLEVYLAAGANNLVVAMEPTPRILDVIRTQAAVSGVFGTVVDSTGRGIPGVEVEGTVHRTGVMRTNAEGQFAIGDAKPGPEMLTVAKPGLKPKLVSLTVQPTGGTKVQIRMRALPATLTAAEAKGAGRISNRMWTEMFDIGQRMRWQTRYAGSSARDEIEKYARGMPLDMAITRLPGMSHIFIRSGDINCVFVDGLLQAGISLRDYNADQVELIQLVPAGGDQPPMCRTDPYSTPQADPANVPPILTADPNTGKSYGPGPVTPRPMARSGLGGPRVIAYLWLTH